MKVFIIVTEMQIELNDSGGIIQPPQTTAVHSE